MPTYSIKTLKGREILPYIKDLANLRMELFREYPYRYDGSLEYERDYLNTYINSNDATMIVAFYGDKVIGASTGIQLEHEVEPLKMAYNDENLTKLFYVGELLIKPKHRASNIFIPILKALREAARSHQCNKMIFCVIDRPENDPKKPKDYLPLDKLWTYFNCKKNPSKSATLYWKEIDEKDESPKKLIFWERKI